jgi:hypothetical protein
VIYTENVNVRRNWEVCSREPVENRWTAMYVSLNKLGDLVLNRVAYERLGEPDRVQLLFDRERDTIGVRRVSYDDEPNAFPVRPRGGRGGYRIRANRLLREFGISIKTTRVFTGCQIDKTGVLCLNIMTSDSLRQETHW